MKDQLGRELTYLRVSVVDRCNLRCFYCMPQEGAGFDPWQQILSYEEIHRLVTIFARLGVSKVRLTGGEPLVRRGIEKLVEKIRSVPGIREIALSTNGILLKEMAPQLKSAGLDRINISLDTLRRDRFERIARMDRFKEVMEGIEAALEAGLAPVKINTVLMKGVNDDEILDLVNFGIRHSIEIRFIELMPTHESVSVDPMKNFFSTQEAKQIIEQVYRLKPVDVYLSSPAQVFEIEGTRARLGLISPISCFFCSRCNRLRVKANGMMKTCLHGKEDLDLKTLLRSSVSDEEISSAIQSVVYVRPEQHFLNDTNVRHQDFQMSHVGG